MKFTNQTSIKTVLGLYRQLRWAPEPTSTVQLAVSGPWEVVASLAGLEKDRDLRIHVRSSRRHILVAILPGEGAEHLLGWYIEDLLVQAARVVEDANHKSINLAFSAAAKAQGEAVMGQGRSNPGLDEALRHVVENLLDVLGERAK